MDFIAKPKIVGSALELPIKNDSFKAVFFMETLEHLPKNREHLALREIKRILKLDGFVILTTPHRTFVHTWLDVAYWLQGHRHYNRAEITSLLKGAGFKIEYLSIMGGYWVLPLSLFYYFVTKPFGIEMPKWLLGKADREYD